MLPIDYNKHARMCVSYEEEDTCVMLPIHYNTHARAHTQSIGRSLCVCV
jgi:hypothetical protein